MMNIATNNYTSINSIQFKSKKCEVSSLQERAPFFSETETVIDRVYDNYKKSLNEVSFHEIKTTALELAQETQTPKKEVLKAMQLLTQFANMNDLKNISEEINKANIEYMGNDKAELCFTAIEKGFTATNTVNVSSESGVHKSLTYLLDKKMLAPFKEADSGKIAIILDDEKIKNLEQVKKTQPKEFEEFINDKNIEFFYISGWDSGISVIDRTKDLKTETKSLLKRSKEQNLPLEKAIDSPYMDRIKELGIKPTVIKNENEATEAIVYNQMRPEQIRTKGVLYNVIEANTLEKFEGESDYQKAISNHITAKYLDDTLTVYTLEKMSKDLKTINKKINEYAEEKGKEPVYVIPNKDVKSSDFLNYSYKKINNIDSSKFIYVDQIDNYFRRDSERVDNSFIVILDDCALTGNSMNDILSFGMKIKNVNSKVPILFANLKCSDEALNNLENNSNHPVDIIYADKIKSHYLKSDELEKIIGNPQYGIDAYSLVFPYMSPDNNSEVATSVALLHNAKYNKANFASEFERKSYDSQARSNLSEFDKNFYDQLQQKKRDYSYCTKNVTSDVLATSRIYAKTIGLSPIPFEDDVNPKKIQITTDRIYT